MAPYAWVDVLHYKLQPDCTFDMLGLRWLKKKIVAKTCLKATLSVLNKTPETMQAFFPRNIYLINRQDHIFP